MHITTALVVLGAWALVMRLVSAAIPPGTPARARADKLMRLERKLFSDWMQWLTSDWQHERAMANFENTMNTIERELQVNGVSMPGFTTTYMPSYTASLALSVARTGSGGTGMLACVLH